MSERIRCVVCSADEVREFLDLGRTALANHFLTPEEVDRPEPSYALRVGFCMRCTHVQLTERVPPPEMFDEYLHLSSMSETLTSHLHDLAREVVGRYGLGPSDLVIDVGSNDGTLLSGFRRLGTRVLGVDPARNLAALAASAGVETYTAYFGRRTAEEIVSRWGKASAVTATNTFPHIPDLPDFLEGALAVLRPGGAFVIEAHYLGDLLEQGAFDTMYHEHVSYWRLEPMIGLFRRHGLGVERVERLPLHHGQLRVFARHAGEVRPDETVAELLAAERASRLDQYETYERFTERVRRIKADLDTWLANAARHGARVAGYGAPAKSNTLLSFLGIGPERIPWIADRSPLKQGRLAPGVHIPIVPPSRILEEQPDYLLVFAWNLLEEIVAQQDEYRRRGGAFVVPVPEVRVVR